MKSGASGIPHAIVIGADNKIVFSGHPMDPKFEPAFVQALQAAKAQKPPTQAFAPVQKTFEELMGMSVKELRTILTERGIGFADCIEKGDLAERVIERCSNVAYER